MTKNHIILQKVWTHLKQNGVNTKKSMRDLYNLLAHVNTLYFGKFREKNFLTFCCMAIVVIGDTAIVILAGNEERNKNCNDSKCDSN